jgi:helicase SWR1
VHIYRFISKHSVEEAMLRKANQKRFLDDLVIQKGEFDWRSLFWDEGELTKAMEEFEDREDAHAAAVAAQEEVVMDNVDEADFEDVDADAAPNAGPGEEDGGPTEGQDKEFDQAEVEHHPQVEYEEKEEPGTTVDYMLAFVHFDQEHFRSWRL